MQGESGSRRAFLVTDVIYDLDATVRLLSELPGHGVELPVLAVFAPFSDPKSVIQLIHEVPGATLAPRPEAMHTADQVSAMLESIAGFAASSPGRSFTPGRVTGGLQT